MICSALVTRALSHLFASHRHDTTDKYCSKLHTHTHRDLLHGAPTLTTHIMLHSTHNPALQLFLTDRALRLPITFHLPRFDGRRFLPQGRRALSFYHSRTPLNHAEGLFGPVRIFRSEKFRNSVPGSSSHTRSTSEPLLCGAHSQIQSDFKKQSTHRRCQSSYGSLSNQPVAVLVCDAKGLQLFAKPSWPHPLALITRGTIQR